MDPRRRKFYLITVIVMLAIVLFAVANVIYTNDSYVKIEFAGTDRARFVLAYDSTNVTVSSSLTTTVEVLPDVSITITAHPSAGYALSSWHSSGAEVLGMTNDTITLLTGKGGSTVDISAALSPSGTQ